MVTPLTTSTSAPLPDMSATPVLQKETSLTLQTASTSPSTKAVATSSPNQDTVTLSNTALAMSKALNERQDDATAADPAKQEAVKPETAVPEQQKPGGLSALKHFPPFMGDRNELNALKQSSPALYREILRMIVPPPLNLSYTDVQALKQDKPLS